MTILIGGWERDHSRAFQGQMSGFYYNGLKVFNMAVEGDPNIRIEGSMRLVGEVQSSSISPKSSATVSRSETSTSVMEITTTTTSNHKIKPSTASEPQQVRKLHSPPFHVHFFVLPVPSVFRWTFFLICMAQTYWMCICCRVSPFWMNCGNICSLFLQWNPINIHDVLVLMPVGVQLPVNTFVNNYWYCDPGASNVTWVKVE